VSFNFQSLCTEANCDVLTQHFHFSLCTNFPKNRVVNAHFIACTLISNMAAAAILNAVLHFSLLLDVTNLLVKFYWNQTKIDGVITLFVFQSGGCRHFGFDDRRHLTPNLMCTLELPPTV
jgi:hypothetical protein